MIRLSKSVVGTQEAEALRRVIEKGYLGMGTEVQAFEADLAAYIGGDVQVTCVNTGTSALHLALQALGIGPGDEVLAPTLTYVATFQAIRATGATPVACDVDEDLLIDLEDAEKRLTPRTKAIVPVQYASAVHGIPAVYRFAERHGLRVIEDAAHSFGCIWEGKKVGSYGDVICFSFDGIKNITSGEGGAIVTRDLEVTRRIKDARLLGVEGDTDKRFKGARSWEFDVSAQGWRYHMSDIMAGIGRVQLQRFEPEFAPKRRALSKAYRERLQGVEGLRLLRTTDGVVPHILPVLIGRGRRDEARKRLEEARIQSGIHYKPNHLLTYFGGGKVSLPKAEAAYQEILSLPLHPEVTLEQVDQTCAIVRACLA